MSSISKSQANYINALLSQLQKTDYTQYEALTDYSHVSNTFTWFLRQQQRGFICDITMGEATTMIDELKNLLGED